MSQSEMKREHDIIEVAKLIARLQRTEEQLTATQNECTKLLMEKRALETRVGQLTPRKVVAAVIRNRRNEYVIGQRKPEQWHGGKWCFVGGKVELGESLEVATQREVMEELGITVAVIGLRHQQLKQFAHGTFLLHYFDCIVPDGQTPRPLAFSSIATVPAMALPSYDLLPVDIDIARVLRLEYLANESVR